MKRWKIAGICLAVAVAAAASGCGKKTGTETTAAESTAAETEEYVAESSVKLGEYKGIAVTVIRGIRDGRGSRKPDSAGVEFKGRVPRGRSGSPDGRSGQH